MGVCERDRDGADGLPYEIDGVVVKVNSTALWGGWDLPGRLRAGRLRISSRRAQV